MQKFADLHIHTIFSDGILTPDEVFQKAVAKNLSAISFTDHDSIDGCLYSQSIKRDYDIEFIDGIEFSSYEDGKEYHILGYHIDLFNKQLLTTISELRLSRLKRAEKIVQKLDRLNISLSLDTILSKADQAPITRPHIAATLVEQGYVHSLKEAFMLYLGDGCPAYEPKAQLSCEKVISIINKAGGVAVLAHPGKFIANDVLYNMIKSGLDGIEVVHPMHDSETEKYFKKIASQYWLVTTGGSDYHGSREYDEDNFGKYVVPYSVVESLRYSRAVTYHDSNS